MENADRFLLAMLAILHSSAQTTVMAAMMATLCCNVQVGIGDQMLSEYALLRYLALISFRNGRGKESTVNLTGIITSKY